MKAGYGYFKRAGERDKVGIMRFWGVKLLRGCVFCDSGITARRERDRERESDRRVGMKVQQKEGKAGIWRGSVSGLSEL